MAAYAPDGRTKSAPSGSAVVVVVVASILLVLAIYGAFLITQHLEAQKLEILVDYAKTTRVLPSQSLCVRKKVRSYLETAGNPVNKSVLATLVHECEGNASIQDIASKQLKSLGLPE